MIECDNYHCGDKKCYHRAVSFYILEDQYMSLFPKGKLFSRCETHNASAGHNFAQCSEITENDFIIHQIMSL